MNTKKIHESKHANGLITIQASVQSINKMNWTPNRRGEIEIQFATNPNRVPHQTPKKIHISHKKLTNPYTNLKAFSVNNARSTLIVFILRYPHLLEGTQRRQDTASN